MKLRIYVKEGATAAYVQACAQAKTWEEYQLENKLVIHIDNMYSYNPISLHYEAFLITNENQHSITDALVVQNSNAPSYTQPMVTALL